MNNIFLVVQTIVSLMLIGSIILQARGTGLGSAWGGGGESYRSKRGVEKILMYSTIVLVALFLILALVNLSL